MHVIGFNWGLGLRVNHVLFRMEASPFSHQPKMLHGRHSCPPVVLYAYCSWSLSEFAMTVLRGDLSHP